MRQNLAIAEGRQPYGSEDGHPLAGLPVNLKELAVHIHGRIRIDVENSLENPLPKCVSSIDITVAWRTVRKYQADAIVLASILEFLGVRRIDDVVGRGEE
jgi:hypothetical protein